MTISVWEAATAPLGQMIEQERRRNAALQAENDRLREALAAIRDHPEDEEWHTVTDRLMREIAGTALAKEAGK